MVDAILHGILSSKELLLRYHTLLMRLQSIAGMRQQRLDAAHVTALFGLQYSTTKHELHRHIPGGGTAVMQHI